MDSTRQEHRSHKRPSQMPQLFRIPRYLDTKVTKKRDFPASVK